MMSYKKCILIALVGSVMLTAAFAQVDEKDQTANEGNSGKVSDENSFIGKAGKVVNALSSKLFAPLRNTASSFSSIFRNRNADATLNDDQQEYQQDNLGETQDDLAQQEQQGDTIEEGPAGEAQQGNLGETQDELAQQEQQGDTIEEGPAGEAQQSNQKETQDELAQQEATNEQTPTEKEGKQ